MLILHVTKVIKTKIRFSKSNYVDHIRLISITSELLLHVYSMKLSVLCASVSKRVLRLTHIAKWRTVKVFIDPILSMKSQYSLCLVQSILIDLNLLENYYFLDAILEISTEQHCADLKWLFFSR